MKNIINIINFIRELEPREGRDINLFEVVENHVKNLRALDLKGTFLLQYDALLDEKYVSFLKENADICEVGLWFEIVQPLAEAVGEKWHGRYPWDWHNDVGFLMSYEPNVRIKLIDEAMKKFKERFGEYPKCVGSWHIDCISMEYIAEKYRPLACCICRDQVGTDGYNMQGGYYNQAYYPSKYNMFCPASCIDTQIDMPVFRMLGSDGIYAYDYQALKNIPGGCPTLEPVYVDFGGSEKWVKWFFEENFCGAGVSMQYAQAGQENSFGWSMMKNGIEMQYRHIKALSDEGKIEVLTLGEAGAWYRSQFDITPIATQSYLSDWQGEDRKSVWFNSRFYRSGLLWEKGVVRFRDMYIFDDLHKEKYYDKRNTVTSCEYRNMPVFDGCIYSSPTICGGAYFTQNGKNIVWDNLSYRENSDEVTVTLTAEDKKAEIVFREKSLDISVSSDDICLVPVYEKGQVYTEGSSDEGFSNLNGIRAITYITSASCEKDKMRFVFEGDTYGLDAVQGFFGDDFSVNPKDGKVLLEVVTRK